MDEHVKLCERPAIGQRLDGKTGYLKQINDTALLGALQQQEHILPLEDLLDKEAQRLRRLQALKEDGKLDFGRKLEEDELQELFPQVCQDVNAFLGVDCSMPRYGYFSEWKLRPDSLATLGLYILGGTSLLAGIKLLSSVQEQGLDDMRLYWGYWCASVATLTTLFAMRLSWEFRKNQYDHRFKMVTVKKGPRTSLIPSAGHEYAHHVQDSTFGADGDWNKRTIFNRTIFNEGHARGVERHIAEMYREREDNEAFLYDISDTIVGELKSAYRWVCKQLKVPMQQNLLQVPSSRDNYELNHFSRKPSDHAFGNTFFLLQEAQYGKAVYADALKGRLQIT